MTNNSRTSSQTLAVLNQTAMFPLAMPEGLGRRQVSSFRRLSALTKRFEGLSFKDPENGSPDESYYLPPLWFTRV